MLATRHKHEANVVVWLVRFRGWWEPSEKAGGEADRIDNKSSMHGCVSCGILHDTPPLSSVPMPPPTPRGRRKSLVLDRLDGFSRVDAGLAFMVMLLPPTLLVVLLLRPRWRRHIQTYRLYWLGVVSVMACWPLVISNWDVHVRCSHASGLLKRAAAAGVHVEPDADGWLAPHKVLSRSLHRVATLLKLIESWLVHGVTAMESMGSSPSRTRTRPTEGVCMELADECVLSDDEAWHPLMTYVAVSVLVATTLGYNLATDRPGGNVAQRMAPCECEPTPAAGGSGGGGTAAGGDRHGEDARRSQAGCGGGGDDGAAAAADVLELCLPKGNSNPLNPLTQRTRWQSVVQWLVVSRLLCLPHTLLPFFTRRVCGLPFWPAEVPAVPFTAVSGPLWFAARMRWSVLASSVATHFVTAYLGFAFVESLALFRLRLAILKQFTRKTQQHTDTMLHHSRGGSAFALNNVRALREWFSARQECVEYSTTRLRIAELLTALSVVMGLVLGMGILIEVVTGVQSVSASPRSVLGLVVLFSTSLASYRVAADIGHVKASHAQVLRRKRMRLLLHAPEDDASNRTVLRVATALDATALQLEQEADDVKMLGITKGQLVQWVASGSFFQYLMIEMLGRARG